MGWFQDWWQGLGFTGQIMACSAIPMTVILFLQMIFMIIGFGGESDSDIDSSGPDIDSDAADSGGIGESGGHDHSDVHSDGAHIFTIRGIVAFFALGGWAGLAALTAGISSIWSIMIALLCGAAAMALVSVAIRFALKMQSSGNISLSNAISHSADVYITIPPSRLDKGKVTMILQERFVELDAVTDSNYPLKPETKVEVVGLAEEDCLIVSPIKEEIHSGENTDK